MPTIKNIVEDALEIAFDRLQVEPLIRESVTIAVLRKSKLNKFYGRRVTILTPEETAAKKLATKLRSEETKVDLRKYTEIESTIVGIICKIHRIKVEDFVKKLRYRELVEARFQFTAVLFLQLHYTYVKIGGLLAKDHSTLIYVVRQHLNLYDLQEPYKAKYHRVLNEIEETYPDLLNTAVNTNIVIQRAKKSTRLLKRLSHNEEVNRRSR